MRGFTFLIFVTVLLVTALSVAGCDSIGSTRKIQAGNQAADFEFELGSSDDPSLGDHSSSKTKKLSQFRGQNTLLVFWSTWCDVCKKELPLLDQVAQKTGIQILAITIRDQKSRWSDYIRDNPYQSLIYGFADTKTVLDKYKGTGVPETFLLDSGGKFKNIMDVDGQPVTRIVGPRPWSDVRFYQQFLEEISDK